MKHFLSSVGIITLMLLSMSFGAVVLHNAYHATGSLSNCQKPEILVKSDKKDK